MNYNIHDHQYYNVVYILTLRTVHCRHTAPSLQRKKILITAK